MTRFLKLLFSKKSREPNESDSENNSKIFLIKYKGFKINDYPLP